MTRFDVSIPARQLSSQQLASSAADAARRFVEALAAVDSSFRERTVVHVQGHGDFYVESVLEPIFYAYVATDDSSQPEVRGVRRN